MSFAVGPFPCRAFPQHPIIPHYSPFFPVILIFLLSLSWLTRFQFIRWPFSSSEQVIFSHPAITLDSFGTFNSSRKIAWKLCRALRRRAPVSQARGGIARCRGAGTHKDARHQLTGHPPALPSHNLPAILTDIHIAAAQAGLCLKVKVAAPTSLPLISLIRITLLNLPGSHFIVFFFFRESILTVCF